ncbi:exosortase/archaeosortase family protein [Luteolibacter flavescens]|uniref:Exosortase/archaeosortase family protein n=1 Tax=Luteolibacter flavescens TaxID=1859460 RepID=A0ABT3FWF3_9BACT|nr:exosortase/archaeosortase family protein [Luteolibacter flavescens]
MNPEIVGEQGGRAVLPWLVLVSGAWLQLYVACTYGWLHGDYYAYGWYVPPLAAFFCFRLRHLWWNARPKPLPVSLVVPGLVLLFAALTVLRVINRVDPRWTLPLWIQASVVIGLTFFALHRIGGKVIVSRFVPIVVFAASAIPLPSEVERLVVSNLTDSVIFTSVRLLEWSGQPVQAIGDQIGRMGDVVRVTEGCSGIKSAQSFLMAALFFGEWMTLRLGGRLLMVAAGIVIAWTLNVLRASSLAWIRFEHGSDAFDRAHDLAGLAAFVAGSSILLIISRFLDSGKQGRRLVRRSVGGSAA